MQKVEFQYSQKLGVGILVFSSLVSWKIFCNATLFNRRSPVSETHESMSYENRINSSEKQLRERRASSAKWTKEK